jgi:hypothetical protein
MQTAPSAALQQAFEVSQLPLCNFFVAQPDPDLAQHIVKPHTGLRVRTQYFGQTRNRVLAMKAQCNTAVAQQFAMAQTKQQRYQRVYVIHINLLEAGEPWGGQHPTSAGPYQQQMGLRGFYVCQKLGNALSAGQPAVQGAQRMHMPVDAAGSTGMNQIPNPTGPTQVCRDFSVHTPP